MIAASSLSLLSCGYFPESTFELARESRLPKWSTLPSGLSRADVTVKMSYYINSSGSTAAFILLDAKKQKLAEEKSTKLGKEPILRKTPQPGFSTGYPAYEVITVNGITDIVEHRKMEPIFYMVDDPAVWAELNGNK
jgi:hypothetical protein